MTNLCCSLLIICFRSRYQVQAAEGCVAAGRAERKPRFIQTREGGKPAHGRVSWHMNEVQGTGQGYPGFQVWRWPVRHESSGLVTSASKALVLCTMGREMVPTVPLTASRGAPTHQHVLPVLCQPLSYTLCITDKRSPETKSEDPSGQLILPTEELMPSRSGYGYAEPSQWPAPAALPCMPGRDGVPGVTISVVFPQRVCMTLLSPKVVRHH